jgi:hypothetical protein
VTTVIDDDGVPSWRASSAADGSPGAEGEDSGIVGQLASIERANSYGKPAVLTLLGLVALASLVALAFSLGRVGGGADEVATLDGVAQALRNPAAEAAQGAAAPAGPQATDTDPGAGAGGGGVVDGGGAAPPGSDSGTVVGGIGAGGGGSEGTADDPRIDAPARCELDLAKGLVLEDGAVCGGIGVVRVDGPDGPWHNDLRAVVASEGVVGYLIYERDGVLVEITPGRVVLDEARAAYGVDTIVLGFDAEGQHVHLLRDPVSDEGSTTLTFGLG